ncbi:MAG: MarR family transcriptional regulator, organic hydroperoxide resistance regulator [Solirubrobacteraceae bacterium]
MDPAEELRYLVLGAQREGARALSDLLRPLGLTPAQAEVLAVVRDADHPLTVREIGERLVCEGGSPSRLVASVVDADLLARGARDGDRRAVELSLTPQGAKAARAVADAERELHAWLSSSLSERELTTVVNALRKLVDERQTGMAIARRRGTPTER